MLQQSVPASNNLTMLGLRIREHKIAKEKKIIAPDLLYVNGQCFFLFAPLRYHVHNHTTS